MIRVSYTNYRFKPPTEPLSDEQYEAFRQLSDAEFKMQLRQAKKTAGREGSKEFRDSWKFFLIVLVVCGVLGEVSDRLSKIVGAFGVITAICGIIITLALFGTLYSSLLSLSSSSRFVADVAKFLKKQRSVALKATSYREFLTSYPLDKQNAKPTEE